MTISYTDQISVIKRIKLDEGALLRFDCPFCGGYNSFGLSRSNGMVQWNCFRASCGCRGKMDVGYTRDGIKFKLGFDTIRGSARDTERKIPEPLVSIDHNPDILKWLAKVHSLRAYNEGLVDIRYSPTEDRVMFRLGHKQAYTGRAGWALASTPKTPSSDLKTAYRLGPKWMKYGDTSSCFTCGKGDIGVIVEDAPSACAVGVIDNLTGVALLGTMLTQEHKLELRRFNKIIVCLDPDAARKSLGLAKRLNGQANVSVKFIKDDLKYYEPEEIREMLCL